MTHKHTHVLHSTKQVNKIQFVIPFWALSPLHFDTANNVCVFGWLCQMCNETLQIYCHSICDFHFCLTRLRVLSCGCNQLCCCHCCSTNPNAFPCSKFYFAFLFSLSFPIVIIFLCFLFFFFGLWNFDIIARKCTVCHNFFLLSTLLCNVCCYFSWHCSWRCGTRLLLYILCRNPFPFLDFARAIALAHLREMQTLSMFNRIFRFVGKVFNSQNEIY